MPNGKLMAEKKRNIKNMNKRENEKQKDLGSSEVTHDVGG